MNRTFLLVATLAIAASFAAAQDASPSPPAAVKGGAVTIHRAPLHSHARSGTWEPFFCPPSSCLYYAGDFETSYNSANALLDTNDNNGQILGQVWVGVKPERDATVTGATFVVLASEYGVGVNPTPFAIQVGITPGNAGKTVCSTSGNATETEYQDFQGIDIRDYAYTIKRLSKPCKLKKGHVYYVNLLPTFTNAYTYVVNTPPQHPPNHHGWKNDLNDCYFNSAYHNDTYVTCDSQGVFAEFSIALTGTE